MGEWATRTIVIGVGALGLCASAAACGSPSASSQPEAPEVQAKQGTKSDKADPPLRVAFLGDSYVTGQGAKDQARTRWTARVSATAGWNEVNLGLGGTGYTTPGPEEKDTTYVQRVDSVREADPDVVVVSGGRNDLEASPEKIRSAATELFKALDQIEGSPAVVVVAPLWDASKPPDALAKATRAIEDAARKFGFPFVAIPEQPLAERPELVAGDGLHPNADGYRVIADYLAPRLKDAVASD